MAVRVEQVTDSVFCVRRPWYLSCSYIVRRPEGTTIVDTGPQIDGTDTLAALDHLDIPINDVRAILISHAHNDHAAGAGRIRTLSGAKVYYHRDSAKGLTQAPRPRSLHPRALRTGLARALPDCGILAPIRGLLDASLVAVTAEDWVTDGDVVADEFTVVETPGHEHGHLSFWFAPERVLFTGDALAVAGDHVTYMSRYLTRDVEAARKSMQRCLEFDADALCPGHRYPLIRPTRAHLDAMREQVATVRWPIVGR